MLLLTLINMSSIMFQGLSSCLFPLSGGARAIIIHNKYDVKLGMYHTWITLHKISLNQHYEAVTVFHCACQCCSTEEDAEERRSV